jgi:hypothetical protein
MLFLYLVSPVYILSIESSKKKLKVNERKNVCVDM